LSPAEPKIKIFCGPKKKKGRGATAESGRSADPSTEQRNRRIPTEPKLGNKQNLFHRVPSVAVQLDSLVLLIKVVFSALQRPNKSTRISFDLLAIEKIKHLILKPSLVGRQCDVQPFGRRVVCAYNVGVASSVVCNAIGLRRLWGASSPGIVSIFIIYDYQCQQLGRNSFAPSPPPPHPAKIENERLR
jgi:hypothetical protein